MVCWAHESHLWMWESVPQMEVRFTRMSTSLGPGRGTGASMRSRPGAGVSFASARMVIGIMVILECGLRILDWDYARAERRSGAVGQEVVGR